MNKNMNKNITLQKLKSQKCCAEISAYIFSHYYLHNTADTLKLLDDLIDLINGTIVTRYYDLDVCFSIMVYFCGDYGINPANGWIYDEYKCLLIKHIKSLIKQYTKALIYGE